MNDESLFRGLRESMFSISIQLKLVKSQHQ